MIVVPEPPIVSARLGFRLLRPELNRAILEALAAKPMNASRLCEQLMLDSDTSLREQLDTLESVGVIDRRRDDPTSPGEFAITVAGEELIGVAMLIAAWLTARPAEPLMPESELAWRAFAALADAWELGLVQHLLLQPSTRAELLKTTPLSKEKLKRTLRRLLGAGLVSLTDGDERTPRYALTNWCRRAIAIPAAIARWERVHLGATAGLVTAADGAIALLASLPLIRPPDDLSGICALTFEAEVGDPRSAAVWAQIADARVTICSSGTPPVPPDAWVRGGLDHWFEAVIDARPGALQLGGDLVLAETALGGLHDELFAVATASL